MGYITTGIGFDIELYDEIERLRDIEGLSRSQYVQTACRRFNKHLNKQNVKDYLDSLPDKDMQLLKDEIQKRS